MTEKLSTEKLTEAVEVFRQYGSKNAAARALGLSRGTYRSRLKKAELEGFHISSGARKAISDAGVHPSEAHSGWIVEKDPETGSRTSTYWKKQPLDYDTLAERLEDAFSNLPECPNISSPQNASSELLTLYPIADLHSGLMAWGQETGTDYDTRTAADRVASWLGKCVNASPQSSTGIVLLNGDTIHADDDTNQTPRSKHVLDTDTRHFRTLDLTISAIAAGIEYAAMHHERVLVIVLPGNHDPHASLAVLFALAQRYRGHDRIEVRKRPGEWWVHQFGDVMLSAHHGDKAKADRMVHFLADEYAPIWGRTKHRYLFTGHLHHHKSADIGGVQWEQLRAATERDAYAVSSAYSARSQMQAITYHRNHGELQRFKVGLT
jgi:hypothetical protein